MPRHALKYRTPFAPILISCWSWRVDSLPLLTRPASLTAARRFDEAALTSFHALVETPPLAARALAARSALAFAKLARTALLARHAVLLIIITYHIISIFYYAAEMPTNARRAGSRPLSQ